MLKKIIFFLIISTYWFIRTTETFSHDPTFYPALKVLSKISGKWVCDSTSNIFNSVGEKKFTSIRTIDTLTNSSNYIFTDTNFNKEFNLTGKDTSICYSILYFDFDYKIHTLYLTDIGFIFPLISDSMNYSDNTIFFTSDSNSAINKTYNIYYSLKLISNDIFEESFIFGHTNKESVSKIPNIFYKNTWKRKKV